MLARFLKSLWSGTQPIAGPHDPVADSHTRAAIEMFLREPLAHPKTIDYELIANFSAAVEAADYMVKHMSSARNLVTRDALLEFALEQCEVDGLVMEFGVYRGASLRLIAAHVVQEVHGFDSFEGLPQDWTHFQKQGRFSLGGETPQFGERNVRIHKGLFDASLPAFLENHAQPARLVHIDCDVYASAQTVLQLLEPRIVSGTVLVFDEYLNYPGWREHEFKAFQEFVARAHISYSYVGFASSASAVAVKCRRQTG